MNNIVTHTNSYAYEHIVTHQSYAKNDGSWQEATADEIRGLMAILIYFGLVRVSDAVDNYWSILVCGESVFCLALDLKS